MTYVLTKPFDVYLPPIEDDVKYKVKSWTAIKDRVGVRDYFECQVCHVYTGLYFELSHIVDRACGGLDIPSNLLVCCVWCNQLKPYTYTREEFTEWVRGGFWATAAINQAEKEGIDVENYDFFQRIIGHYKKIGG